MEATQYLAACTVAYARAAQAQPVSECRIDIAGAGIRLRFAGSALKPMVMPALAHLEAPALCAGATAVDVNLWDAATTCIYPPPPPFASADYHRYGQRALADDGRCAVMHAPAVGVLFAYDRAARQGFFWTADAGPLSIYERAAPLQTLLHWALAEFGWQIVHAAAVGTEDGGVLLVGNAGAGKSTTALSCLSQPGLRYLCDDKCLVRLDPAPRAFAVFSSGKIKEDMLAYLPQFQSRLRGWDEGAKGGKGLVFLHPEYADRLVGSFPVKALVMSRIARQAGAVVRPASPEAAFRVFGPSTVIWLPGAETSTYRFTAELTRRLPCYTLDLSLEPARNAAAIAELLRTL